MIPVTTQHYPMLQLNLLYTGATRDGAGDAGGAAQGDRGQVVHELRRWSKLREGLVVIRTAGEKSG